MEGSTRCTRSQDVPDPVPGRPASRASVGRLGRARRCVAAGGLLVAAALLAPPHAATQSYDAPTFRPPVVGDRIGLYVLLQDDVGFGGTWRWADPAVDLGVRGAVIAADDDVGLVGGVEVGNEIRRAGPDFPFDVAWVTGVGVGLVGGTDRGQFRVPLGLSVGREIRLSDSQVTITPYAHPRVALDVLFDDRNVLPDDGDDDSDAELHLDLDLGADVRLADGTVLRFGVTLGHTEAVGLGVAF